MYHGSLEQPSSKRIFPTLSSSINRNWTVYSIMFVACVRPRSYHASILNTEEGALFLQHRNMHSMRLNYIKQSNYLCILFKYTDSSSLLVLSTSLSLSASILLSILCSMAGSRLKSVVGSLLQIEPSTRWVDPSSIVLADFLQLAGTLESSPSS